MKKYLWIVFENYETGEAFLAKADTSTDWSYEKIRPNSFYEDMFESYNKMDCINFLHKWYNWDGNK